MEILLFEVGGQRQALASRDVREVLPAVTVTPMVGAARFVEGVVNVRGSVLPVVDTRAWLGLPTRPIEPSDHLIVVCVDERSAMLCVDRAMELVTLASGDFDAVTRIAKLADGSVQVHAVEALLSQVGIGLK
ncbi:MAG: chemotaxis protein CheW [Planctomycetaceae bacterium]|nr:chemotaxis protein CheW [Planctomycetaceae bacterium]